MRLLWDREVGKEEQVDQRVYELLRQGFRLLELVDGRFRVSFFKLRLVEQYFISYGRPSGSLPPRTPKELLFPPLKVVCLVQVW